jgi:hypothetical protein
LLSQHLQALHGRELLYDPERLVAERAQQQVVKYTMADDVATREALIEQNPALANVHLPVRRSVRGGFEQPFLRVDANMADSWGTIEEPPADKRRTKKAQKEATDSRFEFVEQLLKQTKPLPLDPFMLQVLTQDEIVAHNLAAGERKALLRQAATGPAHKRVKLERVVKSERPPKLPTTSRKRMQKSKQAGAGGAVGSSSASSSSMWFDGMVTTQAAV